MNNQKSGSWYADGYFVKSGEGKVICTLNPNFPPDAKHLIAAAPDLLEACKGALEKCPFPVGAALVREQLQEAIAKAEGETS